MDRTPRAYCTDALVDLAAVDAELHDFPAARARLSQALQLEPNHPAGQALAAKPPR